MLCACSQWRFGRTDCASTTATLHTSLGWQRKEGVFSLFSSLPPSWLIYTITGECPILLDGRSVKAEVRKREAPTRRLRATALFLIWWIFISFFSFFVVCCPVAAAAGAIIYSDLYFIFLSFLLFVFAPFFLLAGFFFSVIPRESQQQQQLGS